MEFQQLQQQIEMLSKQMEEVNQQLMELEISKTALEEFLIKVFIPLFALALFSDCLCAFNPLVCLPVFNFAISFLSLFL